MAPMGSSVGTGRVVRVLGDAVLGCTLPVLGVLGLLVGVMLQRSGCHLPTVLGTVLRVLG